MVKTLVHFIIFILTIAYPHWAMSKQNEFILQSPETQTHLIELFTSEGCSSCPPADTWFASLRKHSELWKTFVPIAFHVDYWDNLGWKDPFSKSVFTLRQRKYAKEWKNSRIYTPGFVLNGQEWPTSFFGRKAPKKSSKKVGTLMIKGNESHQYQVTFNPFEKHTLLTAFGAILYNSIQTKVLRGENKGRNLRHEFVVIQLKSEKMIKEKNFFKAFISFDLPTNPYAPKGSIAFWVSPEDKQYPIQALGRD